MLVLKGMVCVNTVTLQYRYLCFSRFLVFSRFLRTTHSSCAQLHPSNNKKNSYDENYAFNFLSDADVKNELNYPRELMEL